MVKPVGPAPTIRTLSVRAALVFDYLPHLLMLETKILIFAKKDTGKQLWLRTFESICRFSFPIYRTRAMLA
jgi:hypothetical protein